MPAISAFEAVETLIRAVEAMSSDDLREFYNELFPSESSVPASPGNGDAADRSMIIERLKRGIEIEEILDLWNVAFPEAWDVHYDDEVGEIHYEMPQSLRYAGHD